MFDLQDETFVEAHVQEQRRKLMQQAEAHRLAEAARRERQVGVRLHVRLLVGLGDRLITWGWRLRVRYGALADAAKYPLAPVRSASRMPNPRRKCR